MNNFLTRVSLPSDMSKRYFRADEILWHMANATTADSLLFDRYMLQGKDWSVGNGSSRFERPVNPREFERSLQSLREKRNCFTLDTLTRRAPIQVRSLPDRSDKLFAQYQEKLWKFFDDVPVPLANMGVFALYRSFECKDNTAVMVSHKGLIHALRAAYDAMSFMAEDHESFFIAPSPYSITQTAKGRVIGTQ